MKLISSSKRAADNYRGMFKFCELVDSHVADNYHKLQEHQMTQRISDLVADQKRLDTFHKMQRARVLFLGSAFEKFKEMGRHINCLHRFNLNHVILTLSRNMKEYMIVAYKMMKVRRNYLHGLENGRAAILKKEFIHRITDSSYELMSKCYAQLSLWRRYELHMESVANE